MSLLLLRCSNIPHCRELIRTVLTDRAVRITGESILLNWEDTLVRRYPESILHGPESVVSVDTWTGVHCVSKSNLCILSYAYVK